MPGPVPVPVLRRLGLGLGLGLGLLLLTGAAGCKRSRAPVVEEVWDEAPAVGDAEALARLAPPWPKPSRALLDNGLITFWLHEPDAPVAHLRLLLPVGDAEALRSAAVVSVLHAHLVATLGSRGRHRGLVVESDLAPDRIEVVIHGSVDELEHGLELLGAVAKDEGGVSRSVLVELLHRRGVGDAEHHRYLLDALENDGYLVTEGGRYRFRSPLLRDYWRARVLS
ncbi:MAG: hypothetical protein KDK70_05995 [Myxococcales bacterium]|nr:hypothetical protein [Myxococcales bacterium]